MAASEGQTGNVWRRAITALGLWTITVDTRGSILEANEEVLQATGIAAEGIAGMMLWELADDPHERALLRDRVFPVEPAADVPGFLLRVASRGGSPRIVEWTAVPTEGTASGLLLTGIDRTVRPGLDALPSDRHWYRQLIGQLPALLWTTDRNLAFTSGAGAGIAFLGATEEELAGVPLTRYFASDDNPNITNHLRALEGETVRYDTEWLGRTYQAVLVPLRAGDEGDIIGVIGLAIDITDRMRAESERDRSLSAERQARRRAEEALAARDEFLSVAAHELYTPMTSLQLALQSVIARTVEGDTAQGLLDLAERQTQRLLVLIHDLLDVSRIDSGLLGLRPANVDLAELARDVGARFFPDFQRASTELTIDANGSIVGSWDAERLDQIMSNLLTNALRHAAGSDVELGIERAGDRARIRVSDRGPGIEARAAERIFGRFERFASTEHHGGLGLGLYIVRQIAEAHGGEAEVSATPGGGATFCIDLPISSDVDD